MKAKDIKTGEEYMYASSSEWRTRSYATIQRVRVVDVPVHPWARTYGWNTYTRPKKGVIDDRAAKNAAQVVVLTNDGTKVLSEDRVPLQHIRMTWAEYEEKVALDEQRQVERDAAEALRDSKAEAINRRLEEAVAPVHLVKRWTNVYRRSVWFLEPVDKHIDVLHVAEEVAHAFEMIEREEVW